MKKLLLTTAVFSVLLIIGCQENSITDPIDQQDLQKNDDPLVQQGTIALDGLLVDPSVPFNSNLTISGQIDYMHSIELVDPMPPAPQYYVVLSLSVDASLISRDSANEPYMFVTSESEDVIYVPVEGIYLLEKYYNIQGREDGMVLICKFLVTTDGVGLNEMFLALTENNSNPAGGLNKLNDLDITFPPESIDNTM
jgi:hypothetical protein